MTAAKSGISSSEDLLSKMVNKSVLNDLAVLSEKTRNNILQRLQENSQLLDFVNQNPGVTKAWIQHHGGVSQTELEIVAEIAGKADAKVRDIVIDLIDESKAKETFMGLMRKAKEFEKVAVYPQLVKKFGRDRVAQQITLRVSPQKGEGDPIEIVVDFLVKDGGYYRIIDAKYTEKVLPLI